MLDQLLSEMETEDSVGVLLAAQLGASPHELQLVVRTTGFTTAAAGLQTKNHYAIATHNTIEHQIILGVFDHFEILTDHPLLYHHNAEQNRVFIASKVDDSPVSLIDEIAHAHMEMFGDWRNLNVDLIDSQKLIRICGVGYGTIGQMPAPFAAKVGEILAHHDIKHSIVPMRERLDPPMKLLIIDDSYFVAFSFEVTLVPTEG